MLEPTTHSTTPKQNDPVVKDVLEEQGIPSEQVDVSDRLDLQREIKDQGSWDATFPDEDEEGEGFE